MFKQNKYTKYYYQIISQAQTSRDLKCYTEVHHILPESLGGLTSKENLTTLTAREHFICHWLLTKMTEGKEKGKMKYALNGMRRCNEFQERYETKITSRVYARIKEEAAKIHSEFMAGCIPWNKGLKLEGEKYKVAGRKNKGRIKTQEEIDKRVAKVTGQKRSLEQRANMVKGMTGIKKGPMSEEHKLSISKGGKGISKPVADYSGAEDNICECCGKRRNDPIHDHEDEDEE